MRLLLDTNVLSELMRPMPDQAVVKWLDAQSINDVYISSITVAEIRLGIALLPSGRRRDGLQSLSNTLIELDFAGRCLPFDAKAAGYYANLSAEKTKAGRAISVEDAMIAAVAFANDLALVTRNIRDFEAIKDLALINPWTAKR